MRLISKHWLTKAVHKGELVERTKLKRERVWAERGHRANGRFHIPRAAWMALRRRQRPCGNGDLLHQQVEDCWMCHGAAGGRHRHCI